ncbi:hypothetical protein [Propionivibrio sp.]|uniref:hypothetical protein n=1 Tax=Propionivibrio sp. TaxID=2212460 RepID=UPI003BF0E015
MEPSQSLPRFTIPIDDARPKGAARFELWAPKLKRRITLFDPFHVRLWTLLESNPRVSAYCERPTYWRHGERRQLIDFWVKAGRRELCLLVMAEPRPSRAGFLSPDENVGVRYIDAKNLASRNVWIENWMRILPYLSSSARFVSEQLMTDIEQATSHALTFGEIERNFHPHDIVLVRTAVFMLLHRGRLKADALRLQPLGAEIRLRRACA